MEDEINALSEAISYLNLAKTEIDGLPRLKEYVDFINSDIEEGQENTIICNDSGIKSIWIKKAKTLQIESSEIEK